MQTPVLNAIHLFEKWFHLVPVQEESELAGARGSRSTLAFNLDTNRLLLKHTALAGKGNRADRLRRQTLYAYA